MGRDKCNRKKAVLQVKGGKTKDIDALDYKEYANAGYIVYLYAPVKKTLIWSLIVLLSLKKLF